MHPPKSAHTQPKAVVVEFMANIFRNTDASLALLDSKALSFEFLPKSIRTPTMSYRQFAIFLKNELLPVFADYRWKPLAFTCDGGRVAVEAETIGRAKDGREYQQQHHILFVVKRGKIVSVRDYLDTLYSARFFATSIPPKDRLTNSEAELQNDKSAHGNGNGSDTGHDGETAKMKL